MLRVLRRILLVLAVTLFGGAAAIAAVSEGKLRKRYSVTAAPVSPGTDSLALARGAHLYRITTCALCHAADGGGALYSDAGPIGVVAGPNLTRGRGGIGALRTDADLVRAIRHGVRPDSTSLMVMPSEVFAHLSDPDLAALLGRLRQLPPVDREVPRSRFRWLGRVLLAAGRMDILVAPKTPAAAARAPVPEGPTPEYGRYLADITGCHGCHGEGLSGGTVAGPPGLPPASNLTPTGLAGWTAESFADVMRTGRRANGTELHEFMPWREYGHMTDQELTALWRYLESVPPRPFGGK